MGGAREHIALAAPDAPLRIAVFTHDTFGLGHVRRSLHILRSLAASAPDAALLLITGSPALPALGSLPGHADVVKIPTLVRTGSPRTRPPHLPLELTAVTRLRQRLIREGLLGFSPDVLLVDNFPLGSRRELLPILNELRERSTRSVLGLRDVLDLPETVRAHWARDRIYRVLETCYDRILVYGNREILDVAEAYGLAPGVSERLRYCGYVTDVAPLADAEAQLDAAGPAPVSVLATVGGGGDGIPLLRAFLGALARLPELSARVVTGPLMSATDRREVQGLAERCARVEVLGTVRDLPAEMASADLVVAMAGYNTVAELLALRRPAVLVPRNWRYGEHARGTRAGTEGEQLLRAQALEKAGLAEMLPPEALSPDAMEEKIRAALGRRGPRRHGFDLGGLPRVRDELLAVAREARRAA